MWLWGCVGGLSNHQFWTLFFFLQVLPLDSEEMVFPAVCCIYCSQVRLLYVEKPDAYFCCILKKKSWLSCIQKLLDIKMFRLKLYVKHSQAHIKVVLCGPAWMPCMPVVLFGINVLRSWEVTESVFVWLQSSGDESAVLWLDQIQEAIHTANQDEEEALICKHRI